VAPVRSGVEETELMLMESCGVLVDSAVSWIKEVCHAEVCAVASEVETLS
jgi:hypothetical protein